MQQRMPPECREEANPTSLRRRGSASWMSVAVDRRSTCSVARRFYSSVDLRTPSSGADVSFELGFLRLLTWASPSSNRGTAEQHGHCGAHIGNCGVNSWLARRLCTNLARRAASGWSRRRYCGKQSGWDVLGSRSTVAVAASNSTPRVELSLSVCHLSPAPSESGVAAISVPPSW